MRNDMVIFIVVVINLFRLGTSEMQHVSVVMSSWSMCSVTCGDGTRERHVICLSRESDPESEVTCPIEIVKNALTEMELCHLSACPENPESSTYTHVDIVRPPDEDTDQLPSMSDIASCDTKKVGRISLTNQTHTLNNTQQSDAELRSRLPRRENHTTGFADEDDVDEIDIIAGDGYNWFIKEYSPCSKTCMGGQQTPIFACVKNEVEFSSSYCRQLPQPTPYPRHCNVIDCPPEWRVGPYGNCTSQCGVGHKLRDVHCVVLRTGQPMASINKTLCTELEPPASASCNLRECPPFWDLGNWSSCSSTCNEGFQMRNISCLQSFNDTSAPTPIASSVCLNISQLPEQMQPCQMQACIENKNSDIQQIGPLLKTTSDYLQLTNKSEIAVQVGGTVKLIPGTSLTIHCQNSTEQNNSLTWYHNEELINSTEHIQVTDLGTLHIHQSNASDEGIYTCHLYNYTANSTLSFHSMAEADYLLELKQDYIINLCSELDEGRYSHVGMDVDYMAQRLLEMLFTLTAPPMYNDGVEPIRVYVTSDWSRCSHSCGGAGLQSRKVTCEVIQWDSIRVVSDVNCDMIGWQKPYEHQDCGYTPCPLWSGTEWSPCLSTSCVKSGFANQKRRVQCLDGVGHVIAPAACDWSKRPVTSQLCRRGECVPVWKESEWSKCSATCGADGIMTRMLECIWSHNHTPAGISCLGLPQPEVTRPCSELPPCTSQRTQCVDRIPTCVRISKFGLCRYRSYRQNCCRTCSRTHRST